MPLSYLGYSTNEFYHPANHLKSTDHPRGENKDITYYFKICDTIWFYETWRDRNLNEWESPFTVHKKYPVFKEFFLSLFNCHLYMAKIVRALWWVAERARFSCNNKKHRQIITIFSITESIPILLQYYYKGPKRAIAPKASYILSRVRGRTE